TANDPDEIAEFEALRNRADEGDVAAIRLLAERYANGVGVRQDYEKAIELYAQAADAGDLDALFDLGFAYEQGILVEKNMEEAARLYQKEPTPGTIRRCTTSESVIATAKAFKKTTKRHTIG
ncbi:MAG: sel1 repeat family protein, partial [Thermoguttaceae bacterium]|nr:sel1 repeat family protein [Thermoguttaceae bacterium]